MNAVADLAAVAAGEASVARAALHAMLARVLAQLGPPPKLTIVEWAERYRVLSSEETSKPGRYRVDVTPILRGILDACSDPKVRKVVCQKSAQIGWTVGVVSNVMGYHVHHKPSVQIAVFPRLQAAKDFALEKFDPFVRATPVLAERISLKSRAHGNSMTRKRYPGGLLKLVGANSPSDVKSTSGRVTYVEEPDDVSADVRGQGSGIRLIEERTKTYPDRLMLIGGTPTAKGASAIEAEMRLTDQRQYWVPCHDCDEAHVLDWRNVTIPEDSAAPAHEVYGHARWEQAYYACPHCGSVWTDAQRIANIRRGEWIASAQASASIVGFYTSELYSSEEASAIAQLARKYLEARAKLEAGEPGDMVAFWNSSLGLAWEYKGELPEEDELAARAEPYEEWTTPAGGLVPTLEVDVQHDRLAVTCWVIGRGEEMWLAYWGELYGQTVVAHAGAWLELEALLRRRVRHASGALLPLAAVGVDCSDGQTSEAAYAFVRRHNRAGRPVLALKGAPDALGRVEIWRPPKAIDPNGRATKASRFGVQVHIVGTVKAKDLLLGWATEAGRVRLTGSGPGRLHWYRAVRVDFYAQLLGEIKVPSRTNPNERKWQRRTDRRNEALDCTVYAVYLARHLRLHLRRAAHWDLLEAQLLQPGLPLGVPAPEPEQQGEGAGAPEPAPAAVADATPEATGSPEQVDSEGAPSLMDLLLARRKDRHVRRQPA